jgi:NADH-quinone oxidoreductase subunit A
MLNEYQYLIFCVFIALALGLVLVICSYLLAKNTQNFDKNIAYECGFDPFEEARKEFNIKYYLVGVLFIIFDLEIVYLLPGIINLNQLNIVNYISILLFFILLTIGFVYEWVSGALDW